MKKETIYIDNEDEITSITDKVQSAKGQIVALVLPKRCTVLQSSVNMKILNRAANNAGKNLVLITSESALLPVAGASGVFVAKTLQSKPAVPKAASVSDEIETVDESNDEAPIDATKSIGELAGAVAVASAAVSDDESPIELGDDPSTDDKSDKKGKGNKKNGEKKNKKLAVPNFDSFRVKLFAGIAAVILLIVGWYFATSVMPKAQITLKTENKTVPIDLTITASPSSQTVDVDGKKVNAQIKSMDKTETQKFQATGKQDKGTKATGKVTLSIACSAVSGTPPTIPAGTGVSTGSLTFITQADVSLTVPSFSPCKFSGTVNVTAQNAGDQYNVSSGRTFAVTGYSSVTGTNGAAMGGGTSNVVTVVSQSDCDNAKNSLLNSKTDAYKTELSAQLTSAGYTPLPDTFVANPSKVSCSPDVGAEATEATATVTFKSSMAGVNTAGLTQILQSEAAKNIKDTQSVLDVGIKTATYTVKGTADNGDITIQVKTEAQAGVKQDPEAIANSIAGKKRGETQAILESLPGVTDVKIEYSPFWVSGTPKNPKHITIIFVNNGN